MYQLVYYYHLLLTMHTPQAVIQKSNLRFHQWVSVCFGVCFLGDYDVRNFCEATSTILRHELGSTLSHFDVRWQSSYVSLDIQPGRLPSRAGVIQGAVNLEFPDLTFDSINVNIDGINAQLPNLDLVNLVNKLCRDEGITSKLHGRVRHRGYIIYIILYYSISFYVL